VLRQIDALGNVTSYTYHAAGNLLSETPPDGETTYTYSAVGARVENTQVRENQNAGYQNSSLIDGSLGVDYMDYLTDLMKLTYAWYLTD